MVSTGVIKRVLLFGAAAVVISSMAGCRDADSSSKAESTADSVLQKADVNAAEILQKCKNSSMTQSAYFGNDAFDNAVDKLYGIEIEKIYDGGIICAEDGSADEVSVIRLTDGSSVTELLEKRLEQRKELFKDYKPEEMPKLDKAEVFEQDGWNCLIISENADEIKDTILELI